MASAKQDIKIDKNSDFEISFKLFNDDDTLINLTGYEVFFIAKEENKASSKVLFLPDEVNINENEISIKVYSLTSKQIKNTKGYFNLILSINTSKYRVLEGNIFFTDSLDEN